VSERAVERPKNIRLKSIVVCDAMLRLCRLASDIYGPDLERFVILLAVISAGASHLQRDAEVRSLYSDDAAVPPELFLGVSRRAIAESVGLPRETVRRRIEVLIGSGHLVEEDGLVKTGTPVLERDGNLEFFVGALKEFERASAALKRADEV
jgi:hypothetical protein